MRIPAGITLIVLGAILTFALKGGHIGSLDLHAVGIILMLAGIVGMLLPMLIRNRSRLSRPTIRSRHDIMDDGTRTVVNHADGSQTLVEHDDGAQTFAEHFDAAFARRPFAAALHSMAAAGITALAGVGQDRPQARPGCLS